MFDSFLLRIPKTMSLIYFTEKAVKLSLDSSLPNQPTRQHLKILSMVLVSMAELGDRFEALLQVECKVYCVFGDYLQDYVDHGLSNSRNAAWRTECIRCEQTAKVPRGS